MDSKILKELKKVLNMFGDKYIKEEVLNKSMILHDIKNYNQELVEELLNNSTIKKHYTKNINNHIVIEIEKLMQTFEMDTPWMNSATNYSKKIGLTTNNKFITENQDVVLDFPYKDTVLKAGMTKEDVAENETVNEPFYNEIMDAEEIDRLLDPKIFVQTKRYTQNGVEENIEFNDDDNLVIKGNNLLALHTLKERYAGKVKLIYIDPPYNTGNDSFQYNDKFNHSTWLTFMKNRIEIAKKLLSDDGSIWINIDDDESHYLKVLCDEIFNRENFVANIIWEKKHTRANDAKWFSDSHDHILVYAKNKEYWNLIKLPRTEKMNKAYTNPDNDPNGRWQSMPLHAKSGSFATSSEEFRYKFSNGVEWSPPSGTYSRFSKESLKKLDNENKIWFGIDGTNVPRYKKYLSELTGGTVPKTLWKHTEVGHNQDAKKEISNLFESSKFDTPKPEKLLQQILYIGSNKGDIILDFFMGSATTQAVAHKMNRKYIGIEQMDYIEDVSVERLKKIIDGEQGGISEEVNWQGGGSFVYAELMPKSMGYLKTVLTAKSIKELKDVYKLMIDNVATDFRVDLEAVREELTNNEIKLEDKKQLLAKIIDKNGLYYNYSEINDKNVRDFINSSDYQFNQSFYSKDD
ncbi:type III restriction endonuclease subunit M [Dolosigranulum pigrum]|uniref:site-specific DNA-methyltransferase n=1 Tax=Dolosigranulum pigrum TaxID=29394 RepID=UPI000DC2FCE6|nr:site-specific DNA-methyltransferase [Dolosigranulum pigrum]RAN59601.1 type III restriction endonuclease subunit M [Dolosigranulum pigrum]